MVVASEKFNSIFNVQYNQWFFFGKSLCMFMFIRGLYISPKGLIGKITKLISPNVLGVYLIHCQHILFGWLIMVGSVSEFTQNVAIHFLWWCLYGIGVLVACVVIDKLRVFVFDISGISNMLIRISEKIDNKLMLQTSQTGNGA